VSGVEPLLELRHVSRRFPIRSGVLSRVSGHIHAVDDVSFSVARGETLAIVGESGCGKSTTGRCAVRLDLPDDGQVLFEGIDLATVDRRGLRAVRARLQMIFQDPSAALTSHMRVGEQIAEPLRNLAGLTDATEVERRVAALLTTVGLGAADAGRFPHEFSGGQKQRVCIARALASDPVMIVCDEAVSALDVSIKAQIVNLLIEIQERRGVGYVFISHDLGIVESISHRVAVMYLGKLVELADTAALFDAPRHPYTEALLAAAPVIEAAGTRPERQRLEGDVPSAASPPSGCRFRTRCPLATPLCAEAEPPLARRDDGRLLACHHR
jgi:oligopeptide transport system ATP-binding protein